MLFEQFSVSSLEVKARCIIVASNRWTSKFKFDNGRSRLCSSLEKKSNYSCCRKLARILKNISYVVIEIITNGTTSLCIIISNAPTAHALSSAPASQHACALHHVIFSACQAVYSDWRSCFTQLLFQKNEMFSMSSRESTGEQFFANRFCPHPSPK